MHNIIHPAQHTEPYLEAIRFEYKGPQGEVLPPPSDDEIAESLVKLRAAANEVVKLRRSKDAVETDINLTFEPLRNQSGPLLTADIVFLLRVAGYARLRMSSVNAAECREIANFALNVATFNIDPEQEPVGALSFDTIVDSMRLKAGTARQNTPSVRQWDGLAGRLFSFIEVADNSVSVSEISGPSELADLIESGGMIVQPPKRKIQSA